ncbi:hypothetical protein LCI18_012212 [Fusarium solani-melongenae]|uniref:Uncharacterized protein n=1 Tax=Fusarium solani subsp. cucurbitae TaxID=2747967 RepID=A0ACD3ZK05_FUSSC|nr:hypothetical protein LCI18_012212 [Fusarium solani-melongenae]
MERDTPLSPECQGDDAGAKAQRDRDSNTEPSATKERFPNGFITVNEFWLWLEFRKHRNAAKRMLEGYLVSMNNIRTATSAASASLDELQVTNATRIFPRRQESASSVPSSTSTQGVNIDRESDMMKKFADWALSELHQMDEILDVIEMLPTGSEPKVSTAVVLGTIACFILAVTIPFESVAYLMRIGACVGVSELFERPLSKGFERYNIACVHQHLRDLLRAMEDKRISEKNKKDLDSWHLWALERTHPFSLHLIVCTTFFLCYLRQYYLPTISGLAGGYLSSLRTK